MVLEGHRFTPSEALQAGLVDQIVTGNTEAVIAKAQQVADAVSPLCIPGSWGISKVGENPMFIGILLRGMLMSTFGTARVVS